MRLNWRTILLIGLVAVGLLFYYTLKSTTVDMSDRPFYSNILDKDLILVRDATLALNLSSFYIKELNFITDDEQLFEGVKPITTLDKGTIIRFNKAYHHTGGVSGITHNVLVGEVTVDSKSYPFEYLWGTHHAICIEQPCGYWTFPAAVWQEQEDTRKYFIE